MGMHWKLYVSKLTEKMQLYIGLSPDARAEWIDEFSV